MKNNTKKNTKNNGTKKIHKKKGGTASKKPKSPIKKTPKQNRDMRQYGKDPALKLYTIS